MSKPYISSMTSNYGDTERVRADVKTLNEILSRQGARLLIDVIAESVGNSVIEFKLNEMESRRILESLEIDLREAILERI